MSDSQENQPRVSPSWNPDEHFDIQNKVRRKQSGVKKRIEIIREFQPILTGADLNVDSRIPV